MGDLDGDGIGDLAVGAESEAQFGDYSGVVYVFLLNSDGSVKASQVIASEIGGGPRLAEGDSFGSSVASLGDIDGDGISDIAVGAIRDDTGSVGPGDDGARGAVYVLHLNPDGTAKASQKIAHNTGGGPMLAEVDYFGGSLASLGDLDGDGVTDIAVGANYDDTGGSGRGAVYVLYLNVDGTAKKYEKIAHDTGGGPSLTNFDRFGLSVTSIGDLNRDGVTELVVGSSDGAVYVLFLQPERLAGDYNLDNVVNAADYTVWRDTLGQIGLEPYSGADGNGDGAITQADYQVWKDHFGQVLTPVTDTPGSGAISTAPNEEGHSQFSTTQEMTLAPNTILGTDSSALAEPVAHEAEPVPRVVQPLHSPAGSVTQTVHPRRHEPRLAERAHSSLAASQDRALVAWLGSRSADSRRGIVPVLSDELVRDSASRDSEDEPFNKLDLAFATLAVRWLPAVGAVGSFAE